MRICEMKGEAVRGILVRYSYLDPKGSIRDEQERLEEIQTVGLMGNYRYTENRIRKEHGHGWRRAY